MLEAACRLYTASNSAGGTSLHFTSAWGMGFQAALEAELEAALAHRFTLQVTINL